MKDRTYTTKKYTITVTAPRYDWQKPEVRVFLNTGNVDFMYSSLLCASGTNTLPSKALKSIRSKVQDKITSYRERAQQILTITETR